MMSLDELISEYEERQREAQEGFEQCNEDDDFEELDYWQREVVIVRDTLSYLRTLRRFSPATLGASRAN